MAPIGRKTNGHTTTHPFQGWFDSPVFPGGLDGDASHSTAAAGPSQSLGIPPRTEEKYARTWSQHSRGSRGSQRSTRSSRSLIRLDLRDRWGADLSGSKFAMTSVPLSPLGGIMEEDLQDHYIHRHCFGCFSTFSRASKTGCVDYEMEESFADSKYESVRVAFIAMSFLMLFFSLCYLPGAVENLIENGHWMRISLLLAVIAPTYTLCGIYPWRCRQHYLNTSGTPLEAGLISLVSACSLALCLITLDSKDEDGFVGLLCLHITFIHNFTPLKAGAIFTVVTIFTLPPYIAVRALMFTDEAGFHDWQKENSDQWWCGTSAEDASFLLDVVVLTFMLLYQGLVVLTRDEYMREDLLNRERVHAQRKELKREKKRCEDLLTSMLPNPIIEALKEKHSIEPQLFEDVTVLFVEVCKFADMCEKLTPKMTVEVLNIIYLELDQLSDKLHVFKVETVMQVYMAVVGCPAAIVNHADIAAHFALSAQSCMAHARTRIAAVFTRLQEEACNQITNSAAEPPPRAEVGQDGVIRSQVLPDIKIDIRIGLNSGRIRAGVVGLDKPRYKLFGDTVNTASRMESTCLPGCVQVSASTWQRLTADTFVLEDRGEIPVKGKGTMHTAFLTGYAGQDPDEYQEPREIEVVWGPNKDLSFSGEENECARTVTMNTSVRVAPNIHRDATQRMHDIVDAGRLKHGTSIGDLDALTEKHKSTTQRWKQWKELDKVFIQFWKTAKLTFLLVPYHEKMHPRWMEKLKSDLPDYLQDTLQERVNTARKLALLWQLTLVTLSVLDYVLDLLGEHPKEYRLGVLIRVLGNNAVGIVYILLLNREEFLRERAVQITLSMWLLQGASLLVCGVLVYHNEPALVIMFIGYVLFDKLCPLQIRIGVCALMVVVYGIIEIARCSSGMFYMRILFVLGFWMLMSFAVRLEEHHEHVANYERRRVEKRVQEISQAKAGSAKLLFHLLPHHVVDLVHQGVSPIAEYHNDVSIIFTDIKGYTAYSSNLSPHELVEFLNAMYSAFDEIILKWGLHKVEIIGDAYFISAGCPVPQDELQLVLPDEYAMRAVEVALALQRTLPSVVDDSTVQMRVGIHSGFVMAGVVGKKGPRYQLFGPHVSYAEKMESLGMPGRVHISDQTHELLLSGGHAYDFEERQIYLDGEEEPHRTWFVNKSKSVKAREIQKGMILRRRSDFLDG